jgi:hypothetical protein
MGKNPSFVGQVKVGPAGVVVITVLVGPLIVEVEAVKVEALVVVGATVGLVVVTVSETITLNCLDINKWFHYYVTYITCG